MMCLFFWLFFSFFSNFKTSSQIPLSKWNARLLLSAGLCLASELKCMKLFAITRAITSLLPPHALVPGQAALVVHWHLAVAEPWMLPGPSWATLAEGAKRCLAGAWMYCQPGWATCSPWVGCTCSYLFFLFYFINLLLELIRLVIVFLVICIGLTYWLILTWEIKNRPVTCGIKFYNYKVVIKPVWFIQCCADTRCKGNRST